MENIHLPPPIVIAPIEDDVSFNFQPASSRHPVPSLSMEYVNGGRPYSDHTGHVPPVIQHSHADNFPPHSFPGTSDGLITNPSSHFTPPTSSALRTSTSVPALNLNTEPYNNCNFHLNPNNPRFLPYGHMWHNKFAPPFVQNQRGNAINRAPIPAPVFPGYDGHAMREMNPMRLDQINAYRNVAIPPYFPPAIFEQYNLPSSNAFSERPMFPLCNTLPHIQGPDRGNNSKQQASPQITVDKVHGPVHVSFYTVDGKYIPCVQRGSELFTSVRSVEIKLLSKFPNSYPEEVKMRPPIKSTKMLPQEADAFSRLNKESSFEYGMESFDNDLLVKLNDFEEFYAIIKKHFPNTPSPPHERVNMEKSNASEYAGSSFKSAGWLQLNNTIVPYIKRGNEKYLPICIVKYAAGLPISDEPFNEFLNHDECKLLNDQCELAGLTFSFHTMTVIGSLDKILQLSNRRLVLNELPMTNPFDSATYDPTLESNYKPPLPGSRLNRKSSTVTSAEKSFPQMPPLIRMGSSETKTSARRMCQTSDIMNELQKMTSHVTQTNQGHRQKVDHANGHAQPPFRNSGGNFDNLAELPNNDMEKASKRSLNNNHMVEPSNMRVKSKVYESGKTTIAYSKTEQQGMTQKQKDNAVAADPDLPRYVFKAKVKKTSPINPPEKVLAKSCEVESQKRSSDHLMMHHIENNSKRSNAEAKKARKEQIVNFSVKSPNNRGSEDTESTVHDSKLTKSQTAKDMLQQKGTNKEVPQIVTQEIDGKLIACLKRPDGHICALLEAVSRVYFPNKEISEILHVVQNILGIEILACTKPEEKAFISFYGLPTSKLKVSTMLKVDTFKQYVPVLKYMFDEKCKLQKTQVAGKATERKSLPKMKSAEKSVKNSKKLKQKSKKSKHVCLDGKKNLVVEMQDFMHSASLRKQLCQLYQIKINV